MQEITFENRAVAFIDVLGFKPVVDNAVTDNNKLSQLKELIEVLESTVPALNKEVYSSVPRDLIPKHIYISDSIILSAPLQSSSMEGYSGLTTVVMRVIQISQILLSKGYLIRGGISAGNVWHADSNIIGTAYQEAYQIEGKTCVPRVELSQTAKELWNKCLLHDSRMCLEYKGHFMVNVLNPHYITDTSHGAQERVFASYSSVVKENLNRGHPESVEYKWWWFNQYLESEISKNGFGIDI